MADTGDAGHHTQDREDAGPDHATDADADGRDDADLLRLGKGGRRHLGLRRIAGHVARVVTNNPLRGVSTGLSHPRLGCPPPLPTTRSWAQPRCRCTACVRPIEQQGGRSGIDVRRAALANAALACRVTGPAASVRSPTATTVCTSRVDDVMNTSSAVSRICTGNLGGTHPLEASLGG